MGNQVYTFDDLDMLNDAQLSILISECPYRLLALALSTTYESLRKRMLSLIPGNKRHLALKDLEDLSFDEVDAPRETMIAESNQSKRAIMRIAKSLHDEGRIVTPD